MPLQDKLHTLNLVDKQVRGLRSHLDQAERRLSVQNEKLAQLLSQQENLEQQLKLTQTRAQSLEKQVQESESRVANLREQMNNSKSNKEYSALLMEVSHLKNEKSKVEDQALEQMNQVDELKGKLETLAGQVEQQQKLVAGAQKEVDEVKGEVGQRLASLETEREEAAKDVPADALKIFDRLGESGDEDDDPMVPIHEQDRRNMEYTCGGCYTIIPIERVNALLVGSNQAPVLCPTCGRILYVEKDLKSSFSSD